MTTADEFEAEYGSPVFQSTFQAFAEGLDGNGILDSGDLQVTAGGTANGLDVAATTRGMWYNGTLYTYAGGTDVLTLSDNTSGSDRWDLVYFDTGTTSPAVREGTPATKPDLPLLQAGEFPLAAVYVADGQTDVTDSEIRSLRVHGQAAEETWFEDTAGEFSSTTVEGAFGEVVRNLLGTDVGEFGDIVDIDVTSTPSAGTVQSYGFAVDGTTLLQLEAEADGAGGIQNPLVRYPLVNRVLIGSLGRTQAAGYQAITNDGAEDFRLNMYISASDGGLVLEHRNLSTATSLNALRGLPDGSGWEIDGDLQDDVPNTIYDYSAAEVPQPRLGGPASSLSSYPLPLASDTDMDVDSTDLTDSTGPGTLYDATAGEFPRGVLDDERTTTTVTTSTYSSSDEEVILVDTATIGAASTITLSSADVEAGHTIVVTDLTGSASSNPVTIDTEGSETINGGADFTLSSDYVGATFVSDGTNWTTTSSAPLNPKLQVEGAESGAVAAGEQGTLIFDSLADGETLNIQKAIFTVDDGTAVPTSLDLIIATLDNSGGYTSQTTIYSGDGSTIWDGDPANSIGDPLASYTNATGTRTTVAVLADNQTAGSLSIMAKATGKRVP